MNKRSAIIFFFLLIVLLSSHFILAISRVDIKRIFVKQEVINTENQNKPFHTAINFLKWYKNFRENSKPFILATIQKGGKTTYVIQKKSVERYFVKLKKTGFLSSSFLTELRTHIDSCSKNLIDNQLDDSFSEVCKYDPITRKMDDLDIMDDIGSLKVLNSKVWNNKASITLKSLTETTINFTMTRLLNDTWEIDHIYLSFNKVVDKY